MAAAGSSTAGNTNKKPARSRPFVMSGCYVGTFRPRSVFREDRAAPAIVDADGDEIVIAANAVGADGHASGEVGEGRVVIGDEQMVVFNRRRPVRGKAEFHACTHGAA